MCPRACSDLERGGTEKSGVRSGTSEIAISPSQPVTQPRHQDSEGTMDAV
jgi:hypothetical protein